MDVHHPAQSNVGSLWWLRKKRTHWEFLMLYRIMKTSLTLRRMSILLFILLQANFLIAQSSMDSLKNLLYHTKEDTSRVILLGYLSQD